MKNYLLDSNFILRIITNDNPILAKEAKNVFEKAKSGECRLIITSIVIAECLYVLTSPNLYKITREKAVLVIKIILNHKNIFVEENEIILESLNFFTDTTLDFADCYLLAKKRLQNIDDICSFDKKLKNKIKP